MIKTETKTISGIAFTQHGGRVTWDHTGKGSASVDDLLTLLKSTGVPVIDTRQGAGNRSVPRIKVDAALGVNVPDQDWLGAYYNNPNLDGNPILTKNDGSGFIDQYFNPGVSPAPGILGAENYSIRWTRTETFTPGTYRFSVTGDDGVRLWINGEEPEIDQWVNQTVATTYNVDVPLSAGNHEIRLEYYQFNGPAQARLNWAPVSPLCSQDVPTIRWKGEYYNNANLAGSAVAVKDEGGSDSLNFNWGGGPPSTGCNLTVFPDNFSVRWTRWVNFAQGTYYFTVTGDNGVRLKVDDVVKIERWTETVGTNTEEVPLTAGNHKIVLEFFETSGGASVSLCWAPPQPSVVNVHPTAYQAPDSELGGLAVSNQTNLGHGDTNVQTSSFAGSGNQYQIKTGLWHSFSNVSGSKTRLTLKFDWAQTGLVEAWDGNPGDAHNAITSLSIDYSTNNGASWTNKVLNGRFVGLFWGFGYVFENINDFGSESVDLPNGIDITQIRVRDSITSNSISSGGAGARASSTVRISNIRLEVERLVPGSCVP